MKDTTPYRERPPSEVAQEVACMRTIFKQAKPVSLIYEAFGGTGETATVFRQRFPKATIQAFDLDQECVDIYNRRGSGQAFCLDAREGLRLLSTTGMPKRWGASLDFNRFTLLDLTRREGAWKRELISTVMALRKPAWLQVTDSAVCYLGTNYRRYGLEEPAVKSYVDALGKAFSSEWGLKVSTWANHRAATYLLFVC